MTFKHGDKIGWIYTTYGSEEPKEISFEEICAEEEEKGPRQKKILMSSRPFWKKYAKDCGIEYTPELSQQMLRQRCNERQNETNTTNETELNNTINNTELNTNKTKEDFKVSFDYSPKRITNLNQPFTVSFFNGQNPLANLSIQVNGKEYTTNASGTISFNVSLGDYFVKWSSPGYEMFRKIFRIGG